MSEMLFTSTNQVRGVDSSRTPREFECSTGTYILFQHDIPLLVAPLMYVRTCRSGTYTHALLSLQTCNSLNKPGAVRRTGRADRVSNLKDEL